MQRTAALIRLGLITVFTVVETVALAIWVELSFGDPVLSTAVAAGLGVLFFGLLGEHLLTDAAVNGRQSAVTAGALVALSVSETVLWGIWLGLVEILGGVLTFGIPFLGLALLLVVQHGVEDNILRGRNPFGSVVTVDSVVISLIEATGATVWLGLVLNPTVVEGALDGVDAALLGLGILAVLLFVEHVVGVRSARRSPSPGTRP